MSAHIKNFYQLFFLLNENQITEILSDLLYHNLAERCWIKRVVKKGKFKKKRKISHVVVHMFVEKTYFTIMFYH